MMWGENVLVASVAGFLLVVIYKEDIQEPPRTQAVASTQGSRVGHCALRTGLGVVYLPAQAGDLAVLVDILRVPHMQGHGEVATLVGSQLCVTDVPPRPGSHHAHLAGTLVCTHLGADGRAVHGGQGVALGVTEVLPCAVCGHAQLAGPFVDAHLQPDDTLASVHGGIVQVPLLLLPVLEANVHPTLQPFSLGLPHQGKKRHLQLRHASTLKHVVGLKQVHRIHP